MTAGDAFTRNTSASSRLRKREAPVRPRPQWPWGECRTGATSFRIDGSRRSQKRLRHKVRRQSRSGVEGGVPISVTEVVYSYRRAAGGQEYRQGDWAHARPRAHRTEWHGNDDPGHDRRQDQARHQADARLGGARPPRAVGVPRAALLPHVARHPGALQAGRARRRLGGPAAGAHDGRVHVVFNKLLGIQSPVVTASVPYAVFSFTGLLPWNFFAGALSRSGVSLVGNANLLTKVYFPRLVIPISAVLAGLVDFAISFVVLLVLMAAYGIAPDLAHRLPAALRAARHRDGARRQPLAQRAQRALPRRAVRHPVPGAALDVREPGDLPDQQHPRPAHCASLFALNPMTGVIGGFRWACSGSSPPAATMWISIGVVVVAARRRPVLLQAHGAGVRGCGVGHERHRRQRASGARQDVPHRRRRARHRTLRDTLVQRRQAADRAHPPPRRGDASRRGALGLAGRRPRGARGRGARHHRPQRRRQEHAAQGALAHHRADRGPSRAARPRRQPARGGHRAFTRSSPAARTST